MRLRNEDSLATMPVSKQISEWGTSDVTSDASTGALLRSFSRFLSEDQNYSGSVNQQQNLSNCENFGKFRNAPLDSKSTSFDFMFQPSLTVSAHSQTNTEVSGTQKDQDELQVDCRESIFGAGFLWQPEECDDGFAACEQDASDDATEGGAFLKDSEGDIEEKNELCHGASLESIALQNGSAGIRSLGSDDKLDLLLQQATRFLNLQKEQEVERRKNNTECSSQVGRLSTISKRKRSSDRTTQKARNISGRNRSRLKDSAARESEETHMEGNACGNALDGLETVTEGMRINGVESKVSSTLFSAADYLMPSGNEHEELETANEVFYSDLLDGSVDVRVCASNTKLGLHHTAFPAGQLDSKESATPLSNAHEDAVASLLRCFPETRRDLQEPPPLKDSMDELLKRYQEQLQTRVNRDVKEDDYHNRTNGDDHKSRAVLDSKKCEAWKEKEIFDGSLHFNDSSNLNGQSVSNDKQRAVDTGGQSKLCFGDLEHEGDVERLQKSALEMQSIKTQASPRECELTALNREDCGQDLDNYHGENNEQVEEEVKDGAEDFVLLSRQKRTAMAQQKVQALLINLLEAADRALADGVTPKTFLPKDEDRVHEVTAEAGPDRRSVYEGLALTKSMMPLSRDPEAWESLLRRLQRLHAHFLKERSAQILPGACQSGAQYAHMSHATASSQSLSPVEGSNASSSNFASLARWASMGQQGQLGFLVRQRILQQMLLPQMIPDCCSITSRFKPLNHLSMTEDCARVGQYQAALRGRCKGKVVLEIGTGPFALLAVNAAREGASGILAFEADRRSASSASSFVNAFGFGRQINIFRAYSSDVQSEQLEQLMLPIIEARLETSRQTEQSNGDDGEANRLVKKKRVIGGAAVCGPIKNRAMVTKEDFPILLLHEIIGDFAGNEGAAAVILHMQRRILEMQRKLGLPLALPQSVPLAARSFLRPCMMPSIDQLPFPHHKFPQRSRLSPRRRLLQAIGLLQKPLLLSTTPVAVSILDGLSEDPHVLNLQEEYKLQSGEVKSNTSDQCHRTRRQTHSGSVFSVDGSEKKTSTVNECSSSGSQNRASTIPEKNMKHLDIYDLKARPRPIFEELLFEKPMHKQMQQRRVLQFVAERDGKMAGLAITNEVELAPGIVVGTESCPSSFSDSLEDASVASVWWKGVALLQNAVEVKRGDVIIVRSHCDLENYGAAEASSTVAADRGKKNRLRGMRVGPSSDNTAPVAGTNVIEDSIVMKSSLRRATGAAVDGMEYSENEDVVSDASVVSLNESVESSAYEQKNTKGEEERRCVAVNFQAKSNDEWREIDVEFPECGKTMRGALQKLNGRRAASGSVSKTKGHRNHSFFPKGSLREKHSLRSENEKDEDFVEVDSHSMKAGDILSDNSVAEQQDSDGFVQHGSHHLLRCRPARNLVVGKVAVITRSAAGQKMGIEMDDEGKRFLTSEANGSANGNGKKRCNADIKYEHPVTRSSKAGRGASDRKGGDADEGAEERKLGRGMRRIERLVKEKEDALLNGCKERTVQKDRQNHGKLIGEGARRRNQGTHLYLKGVSKVKAGAKANASTRVKVEKGACTEPTSGQADTIGGDEASRGSTCNSVHDILGAVENEDNSARACRESLDVNLEELPLEEDNKWVRRYSRPSYTFHIQVVRSSLVLDEVISLPFEEQCPDASPAEFSVPLS